MKGIRGVGFGLEQLLGNMDYAERLMESLQRNGTEQHMKNAVKECLLASKSVIESLIDSLEKEQSTSNARKIRISEE